MIHPSEPSPTRGAFGFFCVLARFGGKALNFDGICGTIQIAIVSARGQKHGGRAFHG